MTLCGHVTRRMAAYPGTYPGPDGGSGAAGSRGLGRLGRMILLDTCTLLWLVTNRSELSPAAAQAVDGAGQVFVSAASAFESGTKHRQAELDLFLPPARWWSTAIDRLKLLELAITPAVAIASTALPIEITVERRTIQHRDRVTGSSWPSAVPQGSQTWPRPGARGGVDLLTKHAGLATMVAHGYDFTDAGGRQGVLRGQVSPCCAPLPAVAPGRDAGAHAAAGGLLGRGATVASWRRRVRPGAVGRRSGGR
jgi:PIN domain nuclease of toxin-antitoxin system